MPGFWLTASDRPSADAIQRRYDGEVCAERYVERVPLPSATRVGNAPTARPSQYALGGLGG
jgi:hypothetical protein